MESQDTDLTRVRAENDFQAAEAKGNWHEWSGSGDPPWWDAGARYVCHVALDKRLSETEVRELARELFDNRLRVYEAVRSVIRQYMAPNFIAYCITRLRQAQAILAAESGAGAIDDEARGHHEVLDQAGTTGKLSGNEPALKKGLTASGQSQDGANRRAAVDAYIGEVFSRKGERITKTDFWKSARYKSRTEFERWERNDLKHPNKTAHQRFTRILTEKPHLK